MIYHTSKTEIEELLQSLSREKDRLNSNEDQIPIDYACGWAHSTDEGTCTLQMLLDKADSYMYEINNYVRSVIYVHVKELKIE